MSDKPEALRLADALDNGTYLLSQERDTTSAELRRLHAEVERLRAYVERYRGVLMDIADEFEGSEAGLLAADAIDGSAIDAAKKDGA